jgi:CRISPR-associated protein, Cas02710 family
LSSSDRSAILLNFFFTAERYEQNGQHDIAALLYYRTLEDVYSNRLQDLAPAFKREDPDYTLLGLPLDELTNRFNAARSRLFKSQSVGLPTKLALLDTVILLDALGDRCFEDINRNRLVGLVEIRNHSIFAHGLSPLTASSIQGLRKLAWDCLNLYLSTAGHQAIDAFREAFTFMNLNLDGRSESASPNPSAAPDDNRAPRGRRR